MPSEAGVGFMLRPILSLLVLVLLLLSLLSQTVQRLRWLVSRVRRVVPVRGVLSMRILVVGHRGGGRRMGCRCTGSLYE